MDQPKRLPPNTIYWRCRRCKRLVKRIMWQDDRWPVCISCWDDIQDKEGKDASVHS